MQSKWPSSSRSFILYELDDVETDLIAVHSPLDGNRWCYAFFFTFFDVIVVVGLHFHRATKKREIKKITKKYEKKTKNHLTWEMQRTKKRRERKIKRFAFTWTKTVNERINFSFRHSFIDIDVYAQTWNVRTGMMWFTRNLFTFIRRMITSQPEDRLIEHIYLHTECHCTYTWIQIEKFQCNWKFYIQKWLKAKHTFRVTQKIGDNTISSHTRRHDYNRNVFQLNNDANMANKHNRFYIMCVFFLCLARYLCLDVVDVCPPSFAIFWTIFYNFFFLFFCETCSASSVSLASLSSSLQITSKIYSTHSKPLIQCFLFFISFHLFRSLVFFFFCHCGLIDQSHEETEETSATKRK